MSYNDILDQNPWWRDPLYVPEEAAWPRREMFSRLEQDMSRRFALLVTGLRRTGKSTILRQLIALLLNSGVSPDHILYFAFDKYSVAKTPDALEFVIKSFIERHLVKKVFEIDARVFLFLDEIQYVDYWQDIIKRFYDQNSNFKFILTGSQSVRLKGKTRESLAGRLIEYFLPVLNYQEYLNIANLDIDKAYTLWDFDFLRYEDLYEYHYQHGARLENGLSGYLCFGQFPETASIRDNISFSYEYIRESVLGKVLEQDLPRQYGIEKVQLFKAMAYHLIENSGSIFEIKNIGAELGISKATAEKYLHYLKEGFLLDVMFQYSRSKIKRGRLLKKAYAASVNFIAAIGNYQLDYYYNAPEVFGRLIETYVYQRLSQRFETVSLWRKGEKEIDFLVFSGLKYDENILPVEVKFSSRIRDKELKTILTFASKKGCRRVLFATKDLLDKKELGGGIEAFFIPYYLL